MRYLILILSFYSIHAQNFWEKTSIKNPSEVFEYQRDIIPIETYQLDLDSFTEFVLQAESDFVLQFPNIEGELENFSVREYSNFEADLQSQYPLIRSYVGKSDKNPSAYLRFSIAPNYISVMLKSINQKSYYIEKYTENQVYAVFQHSKNKSNLPFECYTDDIPLEIENPSNVSYSNNGIYQTYRIAVSTDGEYTQFHGGTVASALAAINTSLTRVNGIYEVDFGVHFNLVSESTSVIYTNPNNDPYDPSNFNDQLQTTLDDIVGSANYDIGHLFSANGGGGNAGCIGCICTNGIKGSGFTSLPTPVGSVFDVDYLAHEIGHQVGGNHTFSHGSEITGNNVEPGSGSTIMGYAGITGPYDVQDFSDPYFVYKSIEQIQGNLATKPCAINIPAGNGTPVVNAGGNHIIPKSTPFKLVGTATDDQQEALTYTWDQNDPASQSSNGDFSFGSPLKTTGPNFRSIPPSEVPIRYLPDFERVKSKDFYSFWDCLSKVDRNMQFAFTARDNQSNGQTNTDFSNITVTSAAGPFKVNSPLTQSIIPLNSTFLVEWDVANTNNALINCELVNILLSTDGAQTFQTIVENTPNDGAEDIFILPEYLSLDCYIIIESVGNVFYTLSDPFTIGYNIVYDCETFEYTGPIINIDDYTNYFSAIASINVPAPANENELISDVNVSVGITHGFIGQLHINVDHLNIGEVNLMENECYDNSNITATFDDSGDILQCSSPLSGNIVPNSPLSSFNETSREGVWLLKVRDDSPGTFGYLESFSLQFCITTIELLQSEDIQEIEDEVVFYPNPTEGILHLSSNKDWSKYKLFNANAQLVQQGKVMDSKIDLSSTPKGVYFIQIQDSELAIFTDKVILK